MTKTKTPRKKKERLPPEPHWKSAVAVLLTFFVANFGEKEATMIGSVPRDLKLILGHLRANADGLGKSWDVNTACRTLLYFLEFARKVDIPEVRVPSDTKWFMAFCNQYKNEIIEQIRLFKTQKAKA